METIKFSEELVKFIGEKIKHEAEYLTEGKEMFVDWYGEEGLVHSFRCDKVYTLEILDDIDGAPYLVWEPKGPCYYCIDLPYNNALEFVVDQASITQIEKYISSTSLC